MIDNNTNLDTHKFIVTEKPFLFDLRFKCDKNTTALPVYVKIKKSSLVTFITVITRFFCQGRKDHISAKYHLTLVFISVE